MSQYHDFLIPTHASSTTAYAPTIKPKTITTLLTQLNQFQSRTKLAVLLLSSFCTFRSYSSLTYAIIGSLRCAGGGPMTFFSSSATQYCTFQHKPHFTLHQSPRKNGSKRAKQKTAIRTKHLCLNAAFVGLSTVSANGGPQPDASAAKTYSQARRPGDEL